MQPVDITQKIYIKPKTRAHKNKPRILFRLLYLKINFMAMYFIIKIDIPTAKKGFKINSLKFNFMLMLLVIIFRLNKQEIIRLTSQPNINAFMLLKRFLTL